MALAASLPSWVPSVPSLLPPHRMQQEGPAPSAGLGQKSKRGIAGGPCTYSTYSTLCTTHELSNGYYVGDPGVLSVAPAKRETARDRLTHSSGESESCMSRAHRPRPKGEAAGNSCKRERSGFPSSPSTVRGYIAGSQPPWIQAPGSAASACGGDQGSRGLSNSGTDPGARNMRLRAFVLLGQFAIELSDTEGLLCTLLTPLCGRGSAGGGGGLSLPSLHQKIVVMMSREAQLIAVSLSSRSK